MPRQHEKLHDDISPTRSILEDKYSSYISSYNAPTLLRSRACYSLRVLRRVHRPVVPSPGRPDAVSDPPLPLGPHVDGPGRCGREGHGARATRPGLRLHHRLVHQAEPRLGTFRDPLRSHAQTLDSHPHFALCSFSRLVVLDRPRSTTSSRPSRKLA